MQPRDPLRLRPALIERPWAGNRLRTLLNKNGPEGLRIGESWELSDHPSAPSGFQETVFGAKTFGEVYRGHAEDLFGLPARPTDPYPFLLKFIDARESLSIQVHPDDTQAPPSGSGGKSECWYVVDCNPDSHVLCGFHGPISPDQLRKAAETGEFNRVLERRPIQPGTFINVPAGTVHAILEGTLICEISQTSSEIARLWDWNRPPRDDRKIDIEAAVRYACFEPESSRPRNESPFGVETRDSIGLTTLVRNRHFEVRLGVIRQGEGPAEFQIDNPHGLALCVVQGNGRWSWPEGRAGTLHMGESWLLPAGLTRLTFEPDDSDLRLLFGRPEI